MEPIAIAELEREAREGEKLFVEFLRRESMSLGVYHLPAGSEDPQDPHSEDEVYYVLDGSAKIRIGDEVHPVEAGDVVFVGKHVDHTFFDIESDLTTLVLFAPAEGTLAEE